MAAPDHITCRNLTGTYTMNKKLSDATDKFFALQGLGWVTRKAISLATVVLTIRAYDQESIHHIDITSVASRLSTTQENRTLDWTERDHTDAIFGHVKGRSRFFKRAEFDQVTQASEDVNRFLLGHQTGENSSSSWPENELIQSVVLNQDPGYGWSVEQIWGFEDVQGQRHYTRRLVCKKGDQIELMRLVYDYQGPVEETGEEDDGLAYGE